MTEIRIAIAGIGNCASSLIQGMYYYKKIKSDERVPGLMHTELGGYKISDIKIVAAFDIDSRKVGKDLSEAIYSKPNNTEKFYDVPYMGVDVKKGPVLDGVAKHMLDYPECKSFRISKEKEVDVSQELIDSGAQILLNYVPVGSEKAAKFYAKACLDAGVSLINCMPVFIASDMEWEKRFKERGLPLIGDDVKSQVGATIVHRTLARLMENRGVPVDLTYQLNVGGNTDFLNMLDRERLKTKKTSKTEAVQSQLRLPMNEDCIHIGPSDYVPWLNDRKICFIVLKGRTFGDVPMKIEVKLDVEDSPNSAGCVIDAIRCAKIGLDRGIGGCLESPSAYFMKHPPKQYDDTSARKMTEEFIQGERER